MNGWMNVERTLASEDENDIGSGGSWGRKLTWSIIGHCGGIVVSLEEVVNDNAPSKTLLVFILNPTPTPCLTFPLWPPMKKLWRKVFKQLSLRAATSLLWNRWNSGMSEKSFLTSVHQWIELWNHTLKVRSQDHPGKFQDLRSVVRSYNAYRGGRWTWAWGHINQTELTVIGPNIEEVFRVGSEGLISVKCTMIHLTNVATMACQDCTLDLEGGHDDEWWGWDYELQVAWKGEQSPRLSQSPSSHQRTPTA